MSAGSRVGIPPRRMKFNANAIDANRFYDNDRVMTIFWNTLSQLFPEGEQFFVQAVRHYRDKIKDQTLQDQISGFIGQEAFHTLAHREVNEKLEQLGYSQKKIDKALKAALGYVAKHHPLLALHVTAILEHYTSTLGAQLLDNIEHNSAVSAEASKLWLHHAVEEVEHRAVSFDVLTKVGGGFSDEIRIFLFVPVSIVFAAVVACLFTTNLIKQRIRPSELISLLRLAKILSLNIPKLKDWFVRDFHPSQHECENLQVAKECLGIA